MTDGLELGINPENKDLQPIKEKIQNKKNF